MPRKTKPVDIFDLPINPDMRGRLITDPNDSRYLRIVPTMPDMSWLNCPTCKHAPCNCRTET